MNRITLVAATGLALVTAGCSAADTASVDLVSAKISLLPASAATASANAMAGLLLSGPVDPSMIDSVMVTVTRVDVLPESLLARCHPPEGDSARGFRPGRPPEGMRGEGPEDCRPGRAGGPFGPDGEGPRDHPPCRDSLVPPDSGWGSRASNWYSLDVVGSGHIDLLNLLPAGLTLASGMVPAGEYRGARLIVSDATIWFNTAVVSRDSVTLQPDTGYPVSLPHRRGGTMGIMTNAGFTIPSGGGDVQLVFDPDATIGRVIVVDSGKVVLAPVLHPGR